MCLTPIRVLNPTRRFAFGQTPLWLNCECGKCKECIKRKQDDWFVRSFYEWKRVDNMKGAVWFPTLTYDSQHLHKFYSNDDILKKMPRSWKDRYLSDDGVFSFPCFCNDDYKRFRDALRVNLQRAMDKGIIPSHPMSGKDTIRFFMCDEFGSQKGRPHTHCLIFVPFYVPMLQMKAILQQSWPYGMVMYSAKYGALLDSNRGTQYVSKYVAKPAYWLIKYGISQLLDLLKKFERDNDRSLDTRWAAHNLIADIRKVCPKHRQSTKFGINGMDYFKHPDGAYNIDRLIEGKMRLINEGFNQKSDDAVFDYEMPKYYARNIFQSAEYVRSDDDNPKSPIIDIIWHRTPIGLEVAQARYERELKYMEESLSPYFSGIIKLHEHVNYLDYDAVDLYDHLQSLMDGRTVRDLVVYAKTYQYVDITLEQQQEYSGMDSASCLSLLCDSAFDFYVSRLSASEFIDPIPRKTPTSQWCRWRHHDVIDYGSLPCFDGFDEVLSIIREIELQIGNFEDVAFKIEEEENTRYRDVHWNQLYSV